MSSTELNEQDEDRLYERLTYYVRTTTYVRRVVPWRWGLRRTWVASRRSHDMRSTVDSRRVVHDQVEMTSLVSVLTCRSAVARSSCCRLSRRNVHCLRCRRRRLTGAPRTFPRQSSHAPAPHTTTTSLAINY